MFDGAFGVGAEARGEIDMDRRTFITGNVAMASIGGAMAAFDWCGQFSEPQRSAGASSLIVIDTALAESHAYAVDFWEAGSALLAVDADVGALWHTRLRHWLGPISGVLRPSDCFVLRTFSLAEGRAFRFAARDGAAGARSEDLTPAGRAGAFSIEAALRRVAHGA